MGRAKRRHVARYGCADVAGVACQRHGRPRRSLRCWRGRRDRNQSRRHLDRPEIVDQNLGAHTHVWNFSGHGCDRNVAAHRQAECALFCRHDSRCWIDSSRTCAGTPNEKGSCARAVATTIRCRCCTSDVQSADSRLYLLFVREQPFMTEEDVRRKWQQDPEASAIFAEANQKAEDITPLFCYAVSPSAAETIVDVAATLGASRVILGAPQRSALMNLLRGNVIREVSSSLPEDIDLLVYA